MRDIKYKFYNPRTSKKSNKEVIKEETIRQIHQLHPLYNVQTLSLSALCFSLFLFFQESFKSEKRLDENRTTARLSLQNSD